VSGSHEGTDLEPFWVIPIDKTLSALRRSPAVVGIIVASFVVVGTGGAWPTVTRHLEVTSGSLADGQIWRLATYVLPHENGWAHVSLNMFVLSLFGWQLERIVGAWRLIAVYLGSGAIGMCLLFASSPINADRGIRSGASLAVFGVVAALATIHATTDGIRSSAMPWALGTCLVLLSISGALGIRGQGEAIPAGFAGFRFGFFNHSLGMIAGVLLGVALPDRCSRRARTTALAIAFAASIVALLFGVHRWT
jgi:membrane associated rhomboid family serine protease